MSDNNRNSGIEAASQDPKGIGLSPYLSSAAVWALAVGAAIGWGSLIVTSSNYLGQGGPAGSILGLLIGAVLMIIVTRSFCYLAGRYPDAGGLYAYTRNVFGYDRAFLISWFQSLTYIAIFWANATSLPLFARYFIGDTFRHTRLFSVFGYEIFLGEALLTLAAIALVTALCIHSKEAASSVMIGLVVILTIGITICFAVAALRHGGTGYSYEPAYLPDRSSLGQVARIALISPWAFVGFENVVNSSEEFKFGSDRLYRIMVAAVITSTALYIFVTLLSITVYPSDCGSWLEYIRNLGQYEGIEGLPAFNAANHYMGRTGVVLLMISLLALVLSSLIAHLRALSRLFYAVARDDILPRRFAVLNAQQIPGNAMMLVAIVSIPVVFVGRTAIGWIVDITTIGATMIYGFVSAAAYKVARNEGDRRVMITGAAGFVIMLSFGLYLLFPNFFSDDTLETETYILLIIWSILGFFFFRQIIARDHARRFGKAIIVWMALLALIILMVMIWSERVEEDLTNRLILSICEYYNGTADPAILKLNEQDFINYEMQQLHHYRNRTSMMMIGMFALALGAMVINHLSMRKWEGKIAKERDDARAVAYIDPLTGVKSKHAYVEQEQEMAQHIYAGDDIEFAVVVCDVNGLKHINDTLGHKAGDAYLLSAAQMICDHFKRSPVFRVGGDEFAIILQGRDYENRADIMQVLNSRIEKNIGTGQVVASLGLAEYQPGVDNTFHAVFQRADALMYERKQELKAKGAKTRE